MHTLVDDLWLTDIKCPNYGRLCRSRTCLKQG